MIFRAIRYRLSVFNRSIRNAGNNYRIMKHGKGVNIDPAFVVEKCEFEGYNYLFGQGRITNSRLGLLTYVQSGANIGYCNMGRFCSIGPNVTAGQGEHPLNFLSTHHLFNGFHYVKELPPLSGQSGFHSHRTIEMGSDVWVGANVYIKDGITIGHGAVIGAGAVVTKDVAPYSIVGGVPAREIGRRFDDEFINKLLAVKWWDWPLERILANAKLFQEECRQEQFESAIRTAINPGN